MKRLLLLLALAGLLPSAHAQANVAIFACEPEWAAVASAIGGDKVDVTSATNAVQNPHQIEARPSLLAAMRDAQIVFCTGAGLESSWLPLLLRQAGNKEVQQGKPGHLMAANYVQKLGVPARPDRAQKDMHAEGNPHVVTDPRNVRWIAKAFLARLSAIDPDNRAYYAQQHKAFDSAFTAAIRGWEQKAALLKGASVVVQHDAWVYMFRWLGMTVAASLEPKPGLPPTASHVSEVIETLKHKPARAILVASYENDKSARMLSGKTGLPVVHVPYTVGGTPQAKDLFSLYDTTIDQLVSALSPPQAKQ